MQNMFLYRSIGGNTLALLEGLKNWNIRSVGSYESMFEGHSTLIDASAINNWNIKSTATFTKMFKDVPTHPEFTQVAGTWNSSGTFIPNS